MASFQWLYSPGFLPVAVFFHWLQWFLPRLHHLRTGKLRLELRGAQYGEVCLSQQLSQKVLATFSKSGATAWRWKDPRLREQFQITLDNEPDCDRFKEALDESSGKKSLFGIQFFYQAHLNKKQDRLSVF